MLNKIKNFILEPSTKPLTLDKMSELYTASTEFEMEDRIIKAALDHYCAKCNRGFKTRGARNSHKSLKHKND